MQSPEATGLDIVAIQRGTMSSDSESKVGPTTMVYQRTTEEEARRPDGSLRTELVYQRLGEFIVIFQWFEEKLLDMICRLHGGDQWTKFFDQFAPRTFTQKVDLASKLFLQRTEDMIVRTEAGELTPLTKEAVLHWQPIFAGAMKACRDLAARRNAIVHATYVHFESRGFVLDVVRAQRARHHGPAEPVSALRDLEDAIEAAVNVTWDFSTASTQIVHWQSNWQPL